MLFVSTIIVSQSTASKYGSAWQELFVRLGRDPTSRREDTRNTVYGVKERLKAGSAKALNYGLSPVCPALSYLKCVERRWRTGRNREQSRRRDQRKKKRKNRGQNRRRAEKRTENRTENRTVRGAKAWPPGPLLQLVSTTSGDRILM